jgi:hypothetical protein
MSSRQTHLRRSGHSFLVQDLTLREGSRSTGTRARSP